MDNKARQDRAMSKTKKLIRQLAEIGYRYLNSLNVWGYFFLRHETTLNNTNTYKLHFVYIRDISWLTCILFFNIYGKLYSTGISKHINRAI